MSRFVQTGHAYPAEPAFEITQNDAGPALRIRSDGGAVALDIVAGDDVLMYGGAPPLRVQVAHGSAINPVQVIGPTMKISRVEKLLASQMPSSNKAANEANAALVVNSTNLSASSEPQVVGVQTSASTAANTSGSGSDACAINAVGRAQVGAIGIGMGAYFEGRRDDSGGRAGGIQIQVRNQSGVDGTYNAAGLSDTTGIWLVAGGTATTKSGVGISINNPFGNQFLVGLGFGSQNGGGVSTASIQDDSSSATSILINGTHSSAAIAIAAGSGKVIVGGTTQLYAASLLDVIGPNASADPLVGIGNSANTQAYTVRLRNSVSTSVWFICSGANNFMTGTVSGDTGFQNLVAGKSTHIGGSSTVIQVKADNSLGFFGATTVAKKTGWTPWTGTATRTSFATSTATLANVAEALKALIDDLHSTAGYGLITT